MSPVAQPLTRPTSPKRTPVKSLPWLMKSCDVAATGNWPAAEPPPMNKSVSLSPSASNAAAQLGTPSKAKRLALAEHNHTGSADRQRARRLGEYPVAVVEQDRQPRARDEQILIAVAIDVGVGQGRSGAIQAARQPRLQLETVPSRCLMLMAKLCTQITEKRLFYFAFRLN